jgi:hypothetical protein
MVNASRLGLCWEWESVWLEVVGKRLMGGAIAMCDPNVTRISCKKILFRERGRTLGKNVRIEKRVQQKEAPPKANPAINIVSFAVPQGKVYGMPQGFRNSANIFFFQLLHQA